MNKFVQIRNLSEGKHRKLKARAAEKGMSISDYVKQLVEHDLKKATWGEIAKRMQSMEPVELGEPAADIVRAIRDEH